LTLGVYPSSLEYYEALGVEVVPAVVVAKFTADDLTPLGSLLLLFSGCGRLLVLELAN